MSEWTNVALKPNGEKMSPQSSSMAIAGNRVRLTQPEVITLVDYNAGTFTIMNPEKQYFWSGSIDAYVIESMTNRQSAMREKLANYQGGQGKAADKLPEAKPVKVPEVCVVPSRNGVNGPPLSETKTS